MSEDIKTAAQARAAALHDRSERYISALEVERSGYVMRGLDDRVAQVDEQIAHWRDAADGAEPAAGDTEEGEAEEADAADGAEPAAKPRRRG